MSESTSPTDRRDDPTVMAGSLPRHVVVIGLGLLGGSVAMSIRRRDPTVRLTACARQASTRQFAIDHQIVDAALGDPIEAAAGADLAVIATPVDRIASIARQLNESFPTLSITDVGSTKRRIVDAVAGQPAASCFLAAHPIAGSEKTGVEHARADLFDRRTIVLTPSGDELPEHADRVTRFWQATGGRLIFMAAAEHDAHLAATSHVPHLLAAVVARGVPAEAMPLVGSGWLDTTRVAAGDPALWAAIVAENRIAILERLVAAQHDLNQLITLVHGEQDASLRDWLATAQQQRQNQ